MSDLQSLFLFEELPSATWLAEQFRDGRFRATLDIKAGHFSAMAVATGDVQVRAGCPITEPNCIVQTLTDTLGKISFREPMPVVGFVLIEAQAGHRRTYMDYLVEAHTRDESMYVAAAHAFGSHSTNVVLEVMGQDTRSVTMEILKLTDDTRVVQSQVHMTFEEHTLGFGNRPGTGG